jgi:hypothetical protein
MLPVGGWEQMHNHPMFHKIRYMVDDAAYWARQRPRGGTLVELKSNRKYSIFGDQFEVELGELMQQPDWATDPNIRCLNTNYGCPKQPDFVCPYRPELDFELKTSAEEHGDIRCGGKSHVKKKPCYYIHVRYDRRTFRVNSVRMGWVRPEDWTPSHTWLKVSCRRKFVEIYNDDPMWLLVDAAQRRRITKKRRALR